MELPHVPNDTHPAVERRVLEALRRCSAEERLTQTAALCCAADELALAGISLREGPLSERERRLHLARLRYGSKLVSRVEAYRAGLGVDP